MSYSDVRGRWWATRAGRTRESGAPLLPRRGRSLTPARGLRVAAAVVLAWAIVNAGEWAWFMREPALRVDPCRGLVPDTNSQALHTSEGRTLQKSFNPFGSVVLPAPRVPRKRVLLLGDSEMASYALDPRDHLGQWLARGFPDVQFVCQAQPNYSVADYIRMADCEHGFAGYDLVIIEGCELDVGAEAADATRGRGLAFARITNGQVQVASEALGWVGRHLGFYNAYWRFDAVGRRLMPFARSLARVLRNPHPAVAAASPASPEADTSRMTPLLSRLAAGIEPPVVWLYVRRVHGVGDSRKPDFERSPAFVATCKALGFTFVDPGQALTDFRSPSGGYANGTVWSQPGTGHLNADGHRLLYEALAPAIAPRLDATGGTR